MKKFPTEHLFNDALIGDGLDITGRQVEYCGEIWTVSEKNYLGDWDVVRYEDRPTGRVKITSSIAPTILPETHGHFARLVDTY